MQRRAVLFASLMLFMSTNAAMADINPRGWQINSNPKNNQIQSLEWGTTQAKATRSKVGSSKLEEPVLKVWFDDYTKYYNKSYADIKQAYTNFKSNLEKIKQINTNYSLTWWASPNHLSDKPVSELSRSLLTNVQIKKFQRIVGKNSTSLPPVTQSSINWDLYGKVTPVKSQECGDCWAYAAATCMESAYLISQNININDYPSFAFSANNLRDCADSQYGSGGCNGGSSDGAMAYTKDYGVLDQRAYKGQQQCRKILDKQAQLGSYAGFVQQYSESALMAAVLRQPVVIYFAVGDDSAFWFYKGGIYNGGGCAGAVNHALVVYGFENTGNRATSYWLVQNSWGTGWGDNGRFKIGFSGDGLGICHAYTYSHFPPLQFVRTLDNNPSSPPPRRSPPPSGAKIINVFVHDAEPCNINIPNSFALESDNKEFIELIQTCKKFKIDDGVDQYFVKFSPKIWYGKDVFTYSTPQTIRGFVNHKFTFYF